jgi:hypothetical protein
MRNGRGETQICCERVAWKVSRPQDYSHQAGMFGIMLATVLAISHWVALSSAAFIFWFKTKLWTRSEEKLL